MKTTVICAVWSGDPDRYDLLYEHESNLANQSVPVQSIYVMDGGMSKEPLTGRIRLEAPPGAHRILCWDKLTIYQAWNVALSLVETPYVMNLNLDDRLAPDAIETLEKNIEEHQVALIGGDWKVCYSQEETDEVRPCYPTEELPFIQTEWPPPKGTQTRLGSSDHRGTFGPATLWRMDNHISIPRYPWRFVDGTKITALGDAIWWGLVMRHLRKPVMRLPTIIGNYHSHPATQAEFRPHDEETKLKTTSVSFI